jgi:hypothetical protein
MISSAPPVAKSATLAARVERFFSLFQPTIGLVENLIKAKTNPQEVVLLLCARLDALASCLAREGQSNRQSFVRLLVNYSGHRDLMENVSAGDLYYELGYHRWLAEGLIPNPGRLHRFSRVNDPVLNLLDRSGVPLTVEAAERLFTRLMRVLTANFRCRRGQPTRKPMVGKPKLIIAKVLAEFRNSRDAGLRENLAAAIQPLLETKTLAGLLYENFRNNAIHGAWVKFDEATFFRARQPHWEPLYSPYYPPFMFVKFPAPFLLELVFNCVKTLKQRMLATGKLPPDVHFHAFGTGAGDLQFLDEELLPKGGDLRLQLK